MNKAFDLLARARATRVTPTTRTVPPPPATEKVAAKPDAPPPGQPYITVKPLDIQPTMPKPRDPTIYRQIMQKHDRMGTRHLKGNP